MNAQKLPQLGSNPVGKFEISDVRSVADLKAIDTGTSNPDLVVIYPNLEDGSIANVLGYYSRGDGGGGLFTFDSQSAATDNGGTIIAPTNGRGRWLRVNHSAEYNVKHFGAKGDGVNNDTTAIQAALTAAYTAGGGVVKLPIGTYKTTATLYVYQNVSLIGAGFNSYLTETLKGTQFTFVPAAATTDFLVVMRKADGQNPNNYCDAILRDFAVYTASANARDGVYLKMARVEISNLFIRGFTLGKGLRLRRMISSHFKKIVVNDCDIGCYFDSDGTVSTTVHFDSCYFTDHRVACHVQNCNSSVFTATIFESTDEQGMLIDAASVALVHCYFEDIGRESVKAGFTSEVLKLDILGGTYVDGVMSVSKYAVISLADVEWARILPQAMEVNKRALVQTTAATGAVHFAEPAHIIPASGVARVNDAVVVAGADIDIVGDDGRTRVYRVITGGQLAAAQPAGYGAYNIDKADGTAVLSSMRASVIYDETKFICFGYRDARGRINGQLSTEKNGYRYNFAANYSYQNGDLVVARQSAAFWMLYTRPSDDKIGLRANELDQVSATHGTMVGDGAEIINRVGDNRAPLLLTQRHPSAAIVKIAGTSEAGTTKNISSFTAGNTIQGFKKENINGTDYWVPFYNAPTA